MTQIEIFKLLYCVKDAAKVDIESISVDPKEINK